MKVNQLNPSILDGATIHNFDDWGAYENRNILYITGLSGSGKSALARALAEDYNAHVISLDLYFEPERIFGDEYDRDFESYIKSAVPNYTELANPFNTVRDTVEWWSIVDEFTMAILKFGVRQYECGRRVIVEGFQLLDDTLFPNKSIFKAWPMIILNGTVLEAYYRSAIRDGRPIDGEPKENILNWYADYERRACEIKHMLKKD